jgi:zinc/manganese transport system substrate-binding protein
MRPHLRLVPAVAAVVILSSCSPSAPQETPDDVTPAVASSQEDITPRVVVTTTVLGSVVGEIVTCALGDDSSMTVLMPLGADPHDFQASSAQVAQMASADLVIANGLGLEEGVLDAVENLEADGVAVMEIASLVDPLPFGDEYSDDDSHDDHPEDHAEEEKDEDHEHGDLDPHFWFDMERMALAAELIGAELALTGGDIFATCGTSVAGEIRTAEVIVQGALSAVAESQRVLVTDHDALGYLAERYDYEVVGVVIPGGSTLGDPNSSELAELVTVIRQEEVTAIFGNTADSPDLLETLAAEVGGDVQVIELFVGSLGGPGSGAESYIEMMTTNATRIANALAD